MNTNLLDFNNDILNIIGDYVKKDNHDRLKNEEQIINEKKIRFRKFLYSTPNRLMMEEDHGPIKDKSAIPKDWIKSYIFNYIDDEIIAIKELRRRKIRYSFNFFDDEIIGVKEDAKNNKIKLSKKISEM